MIRLPVTERREALVAAALRVLRRDGVAGVTTRAVVAEAAMPLGAFHYVFTSRDELLAACVEKVVEHERIATAGVLDLVPVGATLEQVLHAGLVQYVQVLEADPAQEQAMLELTLHSLRHDGPDGTRGQYARYLAAAEHNLDLAAQACGRRWLVPPATAARHLLVGLDGLTTTWLATRDTPAALADAAFLAGALARLAAPARPGGHGTGTAPSPTTDLPADATGATGTAHVTDPVGGPAAPPSG